MDCRETYTIDNIFVCYDSDCVRLGHYRVINDVINAVTWLRDITYYTLVPNQSSLAVFHAVCNVIRKKELGTDFLEQECKQTIVVPRKKHQKGGGHVARARQTFPLFLSSPSKHQQHHSSFTWPCL